MKVKLAKQIGLCFGVSDAIKSAKTHAPAETLGQLAHNREVIQGLIQAGITPAGSLEEVKGQKVIITAHGVSPKVMNEIKARKLIAIDCTCPIVRNAQRYCQDLAGQGYMVLIFGDEKHPEVQGLVGWANEQRKVRAVATVDSEILPSHQEKIALVSQTTQSQESFFAFARTCLQRFTSKECHIVNTTCQFVQRRQAEAIRMAQEVDIMLVIGSRTSANTKNLASLCSQYCTTYHIEGAAELERIENNGKVGICGGTSTPYETIMEVVRVLEQGVSVSA